MNVNLAAAILLCPSFPRDVYCQGRRKHLKTSLAIGVVNGCGIELIIFICGILHKELQLYRYYM